MADWNRSWGKFFLSGETGQSLHCFQAGAEKEGKKYRHTGIVNSDWFVQRRHIPVFETLEPRLLLSADFLPGVPDLIPDTFDDVVLPPKGNKAAPETFPLDGGHDSDGVIPDSIQNTQNLAPVPPAPPEIISIPEVVVDFVPEVVPDTIPVVTGEAPPDVQPPVELPPVPPAPPETLSLPEVVVDLVPDVVPDTIPVVTGATPFALHKPADPPEPPGLVSKPLEFFEAVAGHALEGVPGLLLASLMNDGIGGATPFFELGLEDEENPGLESKPDFSEDLTPGLAIASLHHDFTGQPPFEMPEQANDHAPGSRMSWEVPMLTAPGLSIAESKGPEGLPEGVMPAARFLELLGNGFFDLKGQDNPLSGLTGSDMPPAAKAPNFEDRFPNLFLADGNTISVPMKFFDGVPSGIVLIDGKVVNLDFEAMSIAAFMENMGEWLVSLIDTNWKMTDLDSLQEEAGSDFGKMAMLTQMTAFMGATNMLKANNWSPLLNPRYFIDPHQERAAVHGYVDNREAIARGEERGQAKNGDVEMEVMFFDEEFGLFVHNPGDGTEKLQEEWVQEDYEAFDDRQYLYQIWEMQGE